MCLLSFLLSRGNVGSGVRGAPSSAADAPALSSPCRSRAARRGDEGPAAQRARPRRGSALIKRRTPGRPLGGVWRVATSSEAWRTVCVRTAIELAST